MHINDWLARRAALTPSTVALVDTLNGGRRITYAAWNRAADQTARALHEKLGVQKGDRVALLAMNCVEYLNLWFACGKLGAVLQALNWRLTPAELTALIDDATPQAFLFGEEFKAQAQAIQARAAHAPGRTLSLAAFKDILAEVSSDPFPAAEVTWEDPWVICYTGGTTGLPKGALLTYRSITANSVNTVMSWGLTPDDVAILNAPLFHAGGLSVFTGPLVHIGGASIVCRAFDADQVFDLVRDAGVTLFFGVPTMFVALQQHPRWREADFSKLKLVISGGAPCPAPVFEAFWERDVDFKTGYGLTEAGPNTFWLPAEDVRRKPGAVGYPLFHVDVKITSEAGADLGPNEVGELLIRGPHVFGGYFKRPEETAKVLENGWLRTGDLAVRDEDGCYSIVGRLKDVIISGGENIYPAEVESVLAAHPAIAEVAVIGVPDAKWGEVGFAVAALKPGASLSLEELIEFCRSRLGRFKIPKGLRCVEALPKTGAGKIDKKLLVKQVLSASQESPFTCSEPGSSSVFAPRSPP
jgi:fatty-acyl-CoA synthase